MNDLEWVEPLQWIDGVQNARPAVYVRYKTRGKPRSGYLQAWPHLLTGKIALPELAVVQCRAANQNLLTDDLGPERGVDVPGLSTVRDQALRCVLSELQLRGVSPAAIRKETIGASRALFHWDVGFGSPGVLFTVISLLDGGDLAFPNLNLRIPFDTGTVVTFDPTEPHGIVRRGALLRAKAPTLYLSMDIQLSSRTGRRMGIYSSRPPPGVPVDPELNRNGQWLLTAARGQTAHRETKA